MGERHKTSQRVRMRICLRDGYWYAFAKGGARKERNFELFLAIKFCNRLNQAQKRSRR